LKLQEASRRKTTSPHKKSLKFGKSPEIPKRRKKPQQALLTLLEPDLSLPEEKALLILRERTVLLIREERDLPILREPTGLKVIKDEKVRDILPEPTAELLTNEEKALLILPEPTVLLIREERDLPILREPTGLKVIKDEKVPDILPELTAELLTKEEKVLLILRAGKVLLRDREVSDRAEISDPDLNLFRLRKSCLKTFLNSNSNITKRQRLTSIRKKTVKL
jgi:hypothetical protein